MADTGQKGAERREYQRHFFSLDDGLSVQLSDQTNGTWSAQIVNLSEGGLCLYCERASAEQVKIGDLLRVEQTEGLDTIPAMRAVTVDVRWVLRAELLDYASMGCMFLDPTENLRGQVRAYLQLRGDALRER